MGINKSKVVQNFTNQVDRTVRAQCPFTSCKNEAEVGDIEIGGSGNTMNAKQECRAESECTLDVALHTAASQIVEAQAKTEGGAGINTSEVEQNVKNTLKESVDASCGSTEAMNKMSARTIRFLESSANNTVNLVQIGDVKTNCKLAILSEAVMQANGQGTAKTKGYDIGLALFGVGAVVIVILILVMLMA
jgi:hypothetical protein